MKRRELFRAAAALVGMAALPEAVPAAPVVQAFEPTKSGLMALNNGTSFDVYWPTDDGFMMAHSPRDIDDAYRDLMGQFAPPGR